MRRVRVLIHLGLLLGSAVAVAAQQPTLTPADYGRWERLGAFEIDPTGQWLVSSVTRVDGDRELRLARADGAGQPIVLLHATGPSFNSDGRFLAYQKGVSE